jgi:hypothetical protein
MEKTPISEEVQIHLSGIGKDKFQLTQTLAVSSLNIMKRWYLQPLWAEVPMTNCSIICLQKI